MEAKKYKCACGAVVKPSEGARTFVCQKCGIKHKNPLFNSKQAPSENLAACKNCGAVFPAANPICPECGGASAPEKKNKQEKADATGVREKIKLALLGIVGVGLIAVAVVGIARDRGEERETREAEPSGPLYDVVTMPRQMDMRATLMGAQNAVQAFEALEGRLPRDLDELNAAGLAPPLPPDGMKYQYNPNTGEIALVEAEKDGE